MLRPMAGRHGGAAMDVLRRQHGGAVILRVFVLLEPVPQLAQQFDGSGLGQSWVAYFSELEGQILEPVGVAC